MPIIAADGLTYRYPGGQPALDAVCFTVERGESVGLVGPNGAGKTTLFLCLSGVLRPSAGRVQVAGLNPAEPGQRRKLAGQVGIVFQNSDDQIISATVFDDVAFGPLNLGWPADEVRRAVAEALERVGLKGYEQRVPFHLSGGEKRRVALAGVLAMRPEVLLLDEPSVFLDPRGRRELMALIQQLDVTKLIASHDLDMILDTCTRALVLDHGRVITDGASKELFADETLMKVHGLEVPHRLRK
jgi:cobalt/nickel transport system ATP-binding protein